ncbi:MAG: hypothetical protein RSA90_01790 [Lachnospiraceae bacterium]
MTVTKRDQKLLYLLTILLVVVLFSVCLIRPQWKAQERLSDTLQAKETEKSEMKLALLSIDSDKKAAESMDTKFTKLTEDFYPMMQAYEIEPMITKLILEHGLEAHDFEITSEPYISKLVPYFASDMALELKVNSSGDQSKQGEKVATKEKVDQEAVKVEQAATDENEEENAIPQDTVYSSSVSIKAVGTKEHMSQLIDSIYQNQKAMRVTQYNLQSEQAMTTDNNVTEYTTLSLGLEIYMCQK